MADLIREVKLLPVTLLEAILRVKHHLEVLAAGMEHCTVRPHQVLAVELEHHVKEVIQVATLDHLRVNNVVLSFDAIFWRLYHCRAIQLIEVEID